MAKCRSCHAEIIWAMSPNGKPMPLDAEPVEAGTRGLFVLTGDQHDEAVSASKVYRSHFATCPDAAEHRR